MVKSSTRDNFTARVIRTLANRAGNCCSYPDCRRPTSGPQSDAAKSVNVGVAAHITAAAPDGPRYDAALSPEQRSAAQNGIWLCQIHAKLVDNDVPRYSAEVLRRWKSEAEERARLEVDGEIHGQTKHPVLGLSLRINVDILEQRNNLYWKLTNTGRMAARQYRMILQVPHDLRGRPFYFEDATGLKVRLQRDNSESPIYWRLTISNLNDSPIFPEDEATGNCYFRLALPKSPAIPTIPEIRFQLFADDMPVKRGTFALEDITHTFNSTLKRIG